jgi:hypothetical protein
MSDTEFFVLIFINSHIFVSPVISISLCFSLEKWLIFCVRVPNLPDGHTEISKAVILMTMIYYSDMIDIK